MTFTTLTFLLFVPLVFGLYWALPRQGPRNLLLVLASYFFYGWWDLRFAVLMLVASLVDFVAGLALGRAQAPRVRRAILVASCACSLGLLGFFKYFHFFAENAQALAARLGFELSPVTLRVVLPVGISFYTFQTLSYVIDVYRRRLPPTGDVVQYMAYVSFFPQLVAGPIERASHLLPQFQSPRRFDPGDAREGLRFMLWGFFKKMALADNFGVVADATYGDLAAADGPRLVLGTVCFAFQIYCDFSAYSDIAVGCARLFGIQLMRNFAYPYFSQSVAEFWRRWHISLSSWFSDYVYVPLGGSRVARARRALNVLATFLLSGLWHGASWNFVAWGALNGLAVMPAVLWPGAAKARPHDVPGGEARWPGLGVLARVLATFAFTCLAWVFFRAPTLPAALVALRNLPTGPWTWEAMCGPLSGSVGLLGLMAMLIGVEWTARQRLHPLALEAWPRPLRWLAYTALIWITLALGPAQSGPFIYFQF